MATPKSTFKKDLKSPSSVFSPLRKVAKYPDIPLMYSYTSYDKVIHWFTLMKNMVASDSRYGKIIGFANVLDHKNPRLPTLLKPEKPNLEAEPN
jgi:hypothetical protein